jgi:hypothetical protein
MFTKSFAVLVVASLSMGVAAQEPVEHGRSLDFNLRDDSASARITGIVGEQRLGKVEADFSVLFNSGDRRVGGAGLHIVDNAGSAERPVMLGLGGRLLWIDSGAADGFVLAVGGHVRTTLDQADRVSIGAHLHYAPSITSFNSVDGYLEGGVRAEYQALQRAWVYLGYRRIRGKFETAPDRTLDSGVHLGMRFEF